VAPAITDLPGLAPFASGEQDFVWTVENLPQNPQFACTIPGHYGTMHGDFIVLQPSGGSPSPMPSMAMP
jgi:hypothetical protein